MELVKNIFFNTDKLIENTKIKISYTGKLFEDNAEKIFLHYGFGENWDNVSEIEMEKTELGFQAELSLPESDFLKLCFKDNNENWDNNDGTDYSFVIEKPQLSLIEIEETQIAHRRLRKTYIWSKKIKLAVYKILKYFPRIISGNYKRKTSEN